jgi:hypothetical protein
MNPLHVVPQEFNFSSKFHGTSNPCSKFHGISNPVEHLYHHLLGALKMTFRKREALCVT